MFKIIHFKKNNILKYAAITILFLMSTALSLTFLLFKVKPKNNYVSYCSLSKDKQNKQNEYKYFIKTINGKINIFENNSTKPSIILEKPIIFLPKYDQKLLQDGIYINNINELANLIEDYDD